jgi:hypothetical protein
LCHEDLDDLSTKIPIYLFHIGRSKWDINYVYFEGDTINDIDSKDGDEIDEIEPYERSHLRSFLEEVDDTNLEENEVDWLLKDLLGALGL